MTWQEIKETLIGFLQSAAGFIIVTGVVAWTAAIIFLNEERKQDRRNENL